MRGALSITRLVDGRGAGADRSGAARRRGRPVMACLLGAAEDGPVGGEHDHAWRIGQHAGVGLGPDQ